MVAVDWQLEEEVTVQSTANGNGTCAIVIGGSMAGLLASRILAAHYQRVLIVERDSFPEIGQQRRGVPQGRHAHGLLASGRDILERLFPNISDQIIRAGAVTGDIVRDSRWFFEGGCLNRVESGLNGLLVSRPFLEGMVRARVKALPRIQILESTHVDGLAVSPDRHRVTGIKVGSDVLQADLVVDATGRGSHSSEWLHAMGYPPPAEDRVQIALGYTTRLFRRSPQHLNGDMAVIIPPTPSGKRGGVMIAQEDNRWTVTLTGHFGNYAPAELPGFVEFAKTLPAPFIHEIIRDAEPLGEPAVARFPASIRRRYENLKRFPDGYLVFGDAISSFNPIYGQGMSVAALEAMALDGVLRENPRDLARRFFARAATIVDGPWSTAAANDLRMPEATGPRTRSVKLINSYMAKLHQAAHSDPVLSLAFHQVANLLAAPETVLHPRLMLRVLRASLPLMRKRVAAAERLLPLHHQNIE